MIKLKILWSAFIMVLIPTIENILLLGFYPLFFVMSLLLNGEDFKYYVRTFVNNIRKRDN